jgi:uncharacterized membrane protein HdeD (DUF308 family)
VQLRRPLRRLEYLTSLPSPMGEMWTPTVDSSNCLNESLILLAFGIANTVSNFMVVLMPIPIIWNTQMPVDRRMRVMALLTLGLLACCAGIVRTIYTARYTASRDKTWDIIPVLIASTVELNLGIVRITGTFCYDPVSLINIRFAHRFLASYHLYKNIL